MEAQAQGVTVLPVILYPSAPLMCVTWMNMRVRHEGIRSYTKTPVPDIFKDRLPFVQFVHLPSPAITDRRVHEIARMQVIVRIDEATGTEDQINGLAGYIGAHFAVMGGQTFEIPPTEHTPGGPATVGCIRRQTTPTEYEDRNYNVLARAFTGELYLRPFRVT